MNIIKHIHLFVAFFALTILLTSCSNDSEQQEGEKHILEAAELVQKTYSLDSYHNIQFKTSTTYWIYQKPLGCSGEGTWSIKENKVIIGPNNSNCEHTRAMKGIYIYNVLNESLQKYSE